MASLEKRNGRYRIVFRFGCQRFNRALRTSSEKGAYACLARLEDNLHRAELGLLTVPDDADVVTFLLSDGTVLRNGRKITSAFWLRPYYASVQQLTSNQEVIFRSFLND